MKSLPILLIALLVSLAPAQSQFGSGCLPDGIIFTTQAQIDSFQLIYPGCTQIEGNVEITGNDITTLNGLSVLTAITGNLLIGHSFSVGNPELLSLSGLEGLTSVGGILVIGNNDRLKDLNGLNSLLSIAGVLDIGGFDWSGAPAGNDSLETLTGLNNLTYLGGGLNVICNPLLINLEGLEGLTAIGGSVLLRCSNLTSLSGLDHVTRIGYDLELFENNLLTDLSGLENLDTIGGSLVIGPCGLGGPWGPPGENSSLTSLNGLQNLSAIGGNLHIGGHAINSLEALSNLESVGYFGGPYNGWIYVCGTDSLTSLSGLDNIEAGTLDHLEITDNSSLSECNVESVCEYLASPNAVIFIDGNSDGCNNPGEVEAQCLAYAVEESKLQSSFQINPNPTSGKFQITSQVLWAQPEGTKSQTNSKLQIQDVKVEVVDLYGKVLHKSNMEHGTRNMEHDISPLPAGVYFIRIYVDEQVITKKIIKLY